MEYLPVPEGAMLPFGPVLYVLAWGLITGAIIGVLRLARTLL